MNAIASVFIDLPKIATAFRGDGALSWGDHDACLFKGTEWFFRTGYRAMLATQWIPALEGMDAKLKAGAKVADVGCGHGASVVVMAEAYPKSSFYGFDFHEPSIAVSKKRAADAGIAERTEFEVATAKSYEGKFDLVCFFDCLHDMGDPVGIARHAREHLEPGGTVLLVEPFALDGRPTNVANNPMAAMLYSVSSAICTPNSLSQEVGLGLGAQAGEAKLRQVFEEAGFTHFRRAAETPLNLILEARAVATQPAKSEVERGAQLLHDGLHLCDLALQGGDVVAQGGHLLAEGDRAAGRAGVGETGGGRGSVLRFGWRAREQLGPALLLLARAARSGGARGGRRRCPAAPAAPRGRRERRTRPCARCASGARRWSAVL